MATRKAGRRPVTREIRFKGDFLGIFGDIVHCEFGSRETVVGRG